MLGVSPGTPALPGCRKKVADPLANNYNPFHHCSFFNQG
jgi:hypothetical protein